MMNVRTVLIAEDDADDQLLIQLVLHEKEFGNNFELHFFNNGEELINFLPKMLHKPACILMDLNMPKLGGFDALRYVKQQNRHKDIPVIIMSTSENKEEKRKCLQHGAVSYLVKPDTYKQWNERLQELVLPFIQYESILSPCIYKIRPGMHCSIKHLFF